jgi:hypothetical protein
MLGGLAGDLESTGMFRRRAITSAMSLNGTPSSAAAWKGPRTAALEREPVEAGSIQPVNAGQRLNPAPM